MRKIYLLALVLFAVNTLSAKTTLTLKPSSFRHGKSTTERNGNPSNTTTALTGSILCNTQYVAGTSMTLNFRFTMTNTDYEYCDSLAITFPAGITPTGTANTPNFAPITDNAAGQTPEAYNGVTGQSISWGNNDNTYGGIESLGNAGGITYYNFTVDVTVGAGVTGSQVATFLASGDRFGPTPADLNGTITMFQSGSSINDASCSIGGVQSTTNCNNTTLPIAVRIKNLGTTTIFNFPVSYVINATPAVTETITNVLAPGDSVDYFFTTLGDFTAEGAYTVDIYTGLAGDAINSNDTIHSTFTNAVPTPLSTTAYANDFEVTADLSL